MDPVSSHQKTGRREQPLAARSAALPVCCRALSRRPPPLAFARHAASRPGVRSGGVEHAHRQREGDRHRLLAPTVDRDLSGNPTKLRDPALGADRPRDRRRLVSPDPLPYDRIVLGLSFLLHVVVLYLLYIYGERHQERAECACGRARQFSEDRTNYSRSSAGASGAGGNVEGCS